MGEGKGSVYDTFTRYKYHTDPLSLLRMDPSDKEKSLGVAKEPNSTLNSEETGVEPPMPPKSNTQLLKVPLPKSNTDENVISEPREVDKDEGCDTVGGSDSLTLPVITNRGMTDNVDVVSFDIENPDLIPYAEVRKFLLELMPRGTFKSTVTTEGFPLYAWLFNPNLRIHIASETLEKALLYAGAVKGHLEGNQSYREVFKTIYNTFPDAKKSTDKWTNSELNVAGRTSLTREPNLSCGSPDVPKVGQHYDIIIVDDLMGPTNISDTGIEKAINYYKGLLSVLEPGGILIFIGTRWHFKDVYGYIMANETRFGTIVRGAYNDDGSLFFPERLSPDYLDEQRKSQGSYFFGAQYLNKIIDDENADFKRSFFRNEHVKLDSDENPVNVFMMVDPVPPGSEEKNDPDYFAISVGGIDKAGCLYYLDGWLARPTPGEAIDKIFQLADQWKPKMLGFESQSFAKLYSFMLREEMRKRDKNIPIKEIKRSDRRESKVQRIRRLVPYYERGDVVHRLGAQRVANLEDQFLEFPRGSHDDLIDCFADLVDIGWLPVRNEAKEERERKREKIRMRSYRNPITRY